MNQVILRRNDPFGALVDDVFNDFFQRAGFVPGRGVEGPTSTRARMDVLDKGEKFEIKLDLPGVSKDDIQVSIDGNEVTISGEIKKESEEKKGEEVLRSERYYGKVSRSFTLPHDVDEAKVVAKYADGVLKLTLPMKSKSASKKITVN